MHSDAFAIVTLILALFNGVFWGYTLARLFGLIGVVLALPIAMGTGYLIPYVLELFMS